MKEFADDNFKLDENCGKFSIRVENTVVKGEITHYERYLLFSTVFSKDLYFRHVKSRACLERIKKDSNNRTWLSNYRKHCLGKEESTFPRIFASLFTAGL